MEAVLTLARPRLVALGAVLGSLALLGSAAQPATASQEVTRYSVAGGCYSLAPSGSGKSLAAASKLRLKATTLGRYMLFTKGKDFVAASGGGVGHDSQPSPAADWAVRNAGPGSFTLSPVSAHDSVLSADGNGDLSLVSSDGAGASSRFRFVKSKGCSVFPEAQLGVSGKPAKGRTPYGEVRGMLDGHMHWMTYSYFGGNFHCGSPWNRYGIPSALPDCSSIEGPQGVNAPSQNFLNYGQPVAPHDTTGWPKLTEWGPHQVTYEGTYYRWVERAWKAGLRMIVMSVNENRELCRIQETRQYPCDEMTTVRRGLRNIKQMQRYVDAQAGGPGRGFFRIVRNPFQARKVIARGKMAVVLEVEVSELFGCKGADPSSCSRTIVNNGLNDLYKRGVRSSLLLNKFDNPLAGVRFDGGPIGVLLNAGNRDSYGSFWSAQTCPGAKHDNTISGAPSDPFLDQVLALLGVAPGTIPTYPPAPHCNTRGLTALGAHTVRRMIRKQMIVNPDHMSQKAVDDTLTIAESKRYSGVISPHGWMDPGNWPRIWKLGGMAFPGAGSAEGFAAAWKAYRPTRTPYYFGWGYGADLGGLGVQGSPVAEDSPNAVKYPFRSIDGSTVVRKQRTGDRVFDYPKEGVDHYGLYADWTKEVTNTGGPKIKRDLLHGSEAYLQMWERSVGVPASRCQNSHAHFAPGGLGRLRLGLGYKPLLEHAGQPIRRTRAWSYCRKGAPQPPCGRCRGADARRLRGDGRVERSRQQGPRRRPRGCGGAASRRSPSDRRRNMDNQAGRQRRCLCRRRRPGPHGRAHRPRLPEHLAAQLPVARSAQGHAPARARDRRGFEQGDPRQGRAAGRPARLAAVPLLLRRLVPATSSGVPGLLRYVWSTTKETRS
jgi:microsomal dipeptidase-like Zn-dependent dipeptidase